MASSLHISNSLLLSSLDTTQYTGIYYSYSYILYNMAAILISDIVIALRFAKDSYVNTPRKNTLAFYLNPIGSPPSSISTIMTTLCSTYNSENASSFSSASSSSVAFILAFEIASSTFKFATILHSPSLHVQGNEYMRPSLTP